MKYFHAEEDPKARLPKNFVSGFLEVSPHLCANETFVPVLTKPIRRVGIRDVNQQHVHSNPIFILVNERHFTPSASA